RDARACAAGGRQPARRPRGRSVRRACHPSDRRTHVIRVVLVDDQALFRAGIRMLLSSQPDLEVVGEAGDGRAGIEVVAATRPDVVLMDVRMPVLDGLAATAAVLATAEPPKVVMLTTFDLDEAAARAIRQGASGFLLKDA